jgi:hypothetical protein
VVTKLFLLLFLQLLNYSSVHKSIDVLINRASSCDSDASVAVQLFYPKEPSLGFLYISSTLIQQDSCCFVQL